MFKSTTLALVALLSLFAAPAWSATSITLSDSTPDFFGFLEDENVLQITAPAKFAIEGNFTNTANSQLNITQLGNDGSFLSYSFTETPIDFVTPTFFNPGFYLFEAKAAGDNTSSFAVTISAVPLPAAAWLFGSAILGFALFSTARRV